MPVKPESHHHTCPGSTDHHCPGCCSCECCGGYRKYYLPPPDDQPMDLSDDGESTSVFSPQPWVFNSSYKTIGENPNQIPLFPSRQEAQQQGSRGIAGGGFGHQLPQQQQQ